MSHSRTVYLVLTLALASGDVIASEAQGTTPVEANKIIGNGSPAEATREADKRIGSSRTDEVIEASKIIGNGSPAQPVADNKIIGSGDQALAPIDFKAAAASRD